jgi:hypothetical protein
MRAVRFVLGVVPLGLLGCGLLYGDDGSAEPSSPWPWVCDGGLAAPEAGCLPAPCMDGAAGSTGADGGC